MKIAIFASGNGSNFQAIAESIEKGQIAAEIALLFCDQRNAYALERGKKLNIPTYSFHPKEFPSKANYEAEILKLLQENQIQLIVLAGYMRLIGSTLLDAYPKQIINIHPSLLPDFPGLHGIQDAFEAGVSETGVTVHYVDSGMDTGPIIQQGKVQVLASDTLADLEERIHQLEHKLYPAVLQEVVAELQERKDFVE